MKRVFLYAIAALALIAAPAHAHKVIAAVYPSGAEIEGEIGFSNGDMAVDALVEIFDDAGNKLGETTTDEDGFFTFTPTVDVKHIFKSNLGAGHVANIEMDEVEIAKILGKEVAKAEMETAIEQAASTPTNDAKAEITVASLTPEEMEVIAKAVRDEMRPLRQEISAYKEKNNMQTILGGMGYIAGLFGLGFYIAAQRKLKA